MHYRDDNFLSWSVRRASVYGAIIIVVGATIFYFAQFNSAVKSVVGYGSQTAFLGLFLIVVGLATPFLQLYINFLNEKKKRRRPESLPESAKLKLIEEQLADADARVFISDFAGASEQYHSAAQIYLSLENWASSAKCYWTAAETLSKASAARVLVIGFDFYGFGVALLYADAAFAYRLSHDLEKFKESAVLAERAYEKITDTRAKGRVSFIFTILADIQKGETRQLGENLENNVRKIEGYGQYTEELVTLVKKNLDATND
jgi:hypothetical protein